MRCPSCGTDNEVDSRFCGGCGARLAISEAPRVAPTVKVLDDAPYPPQPAYTPPTNSMVPTPPRNPSFPPGSSRAPTPMPVGSQHPRPPTPLPNGSIPPQTSARPARAQSPAVSQLSQPGLSMPVVRRPWGLISVVILVDLALAGTGAVLLAKGLAHEAKSASSGSAAAPPPPPPTPAPAPAAAPAPSPSPTPAPPAPAASGSGSSAEAEPPPEPAKEPPKAAAKRKEPPKKVTSPDKLDPQDPYTPSLQNEVELAAQRSQAAFAKCHHDADQAAPVHGEIRIAFQVLPNGHVTHAQPVANTTGSAMLASCLVSTIVRWTFAVKPAAATDFMRPFTYP